MTIKINNRVDSYLWKLISLFGYDMGFSYHKNSWILSEIFLLALKSYWPSIPADNTERFQSIKPLQADDNDQEIGFESVNEKYRIVGSLVYDAGEIIVNDILLLTSRIDESNVMYSEVSDSILESFNKELEHAIAAFQNHYDFKLLTRDFFETFHRNNFTSISGTEAEQFYHIYCRACEAYPDFAREDEKKKNPDKVLKYQAKLLKAAWKRVSGKSSRDIYACAKATYEVFKDEDLLGKVNFYDEVLGKVKFGEAISYRYKDRYAYDSSECYEKHCLIFITYRYYLGAGIPCCRSLLCSDLWLFLVRESESKLDIQLDGRKDTYGSTTSLSIE